MKKVVDQVEQELIEGIISVAYDCGVTDTKLNINLKDEVIKRCAEIIIKYFTK